MADGCSLQGWLQMSETSGAFLRSCDPSLRPVHRPSLVRMNPNQIWFCVMTVFIRLMDGQTVCVDHADGAVMVPVALVGKRCNGSLILDGGHSHPSSTKDEEWSTFKLLHHCIACPKYCHSINSIYLQFHRINQIICQHLKRMEQDW